jgi:mannose/fructose-specific phosphotransferase system component IIA
MKVVPRKVVRASNLQMLVELMEARERPSTPELAAKQAKLLAVLRVRKQAS